MTVYIHASLDMNVFSNVQKLVHAGQILSVKLMLKKYKWKIHSKILVMQFTLLCAIIG